MKMSMRLLDATAENISATAEIIKKGGLVVYPTDTVYGLGCDPLNHDAIERLLTVKGSRDKPFPILAASLDDVAEVAELSPTVRAIGEKYWPGPLTLVLPKNPLPVAATLGLDTIGVRIPNNRIALHLISLSGGILVGTSANKTGAPPVSTADAARAQLNDEVDVILDGGAAELGVSSTVIDLTEAKPRVLRMGAANPETVLKSFQRGI
jgi:L-threonylcarbamoyladenylate synthase